MKSIKVLIQRFPSILTLLIIFSFSREVALAQYYVSGVDRGNTKYNVLKTKKFNIIYPRGADSLAINYAEKLNWVSDSTLGAYEEKPHKFNVLLHTEMAYSNGFVAWAPKRMEIFTITPRDLYAQDWPSQLAVHEYRHVAQMSQLNHRITRLYSFFLGQQVVGGFAGLYLPQWFLEGDAVFNETKYSSAGRGRVGLFTDDIREQVRNEGVYSYNKAIFGSYKHYTPDHYTIGYLIVNHTNDQYGEDIWMKVFDRIGEFRMTPTPFYSGLLMTTGLGKKDLYKEAIQRYDTLWKIQEKEINSLGEFNDSLVFNNNSSSYESYKFIHQINSTNYIGLRTGIDQIPSIVKINISNGAEEILFKTGASDFYNVSYANGVIVWTEIEVDTRWDNVNYSTIHSYNLKTGKHQRLSKKTRYYSPSLSRNGEKLILIEVDELDNNYLVIFDMIANKVIEKSKISSKIFYPSFASDQTKILFTQLINNEGIEMAIYNTENKQVSSISNPDFIYKKQILEHDDHYYFLAEYSGVMNIFALEKKSGKTYLVTNSSRSINDFNINADGEIYYASYTSMGYKTCRIGIDKTKWISFEKVKNTLVQLPISKKMENSPNIQNTNFSPLQYKIKKYSKLRHLINLHSWSPFSFNQSNYSLKPGIEFMSQNILSTMVVKAGIAFDKYQEKSGKYAEIEYLGFYPILSLSYQDLYDTYKILENNHSLKLYTHNDNIQLNVIVPLKRSASSYSQYCLISSSLGSSFYENWYDADEKSTLKANFISSRLYMHNIQRKSKKAVDYRNGQVIDFNYYKVLSANKDFGDAFSIEGIFYIPGLLNTNSVKIFAGYQKMVQNSKYYLFNYVSLPRGFVGNLYREFSSFKVDYKIPVFHPDLSLGALMYLKRVRANIFYDLLYGASAIQSKRYGIELVGDMHIFRFVAPFEIGVRISQGVGEEVYELIYAVKFDDI